MSAQQNLVPNGSFEDYSACPNNQGQVTGYVKHWFDPTYSSSDYFNICSNNNSCGIPSNFFGYKNCLFGAAYCGFVTYHELINNYREYIAVKLQTPVQKDSIYMFSAYISPSGMFKYQISTFDILLIVDTIGFYNYIQSPVTLNPDTSVFIASFDTIEWYNVKFEFKAKTNSNYLVLGNFKDNLSTIKNIVNNNALELGYLYVDSVSLQKKLSIEHLDILIPNVVTPNNDGVNDHFFIKNLPHSSSVKVYNRWGNCVFMQNNYENNWTPTEQNAGTYYYFIQTETNIYKGFLEIFK